MRRKVFAVIATLAMVAGLLTGLASVASAATPSGTATLTAGQDVLPGTGRDFTVRVNNTGSTSLVTPGAKIDVVRIILPSASGITNAADLTAPAGWSTQASSSNGVHAATFRAPAGGGLAPGSNDPFGFKANVAAPAMSDKTGEFEVSVSGDGGKEFATLGRLPTTIRVLEVVDLGALAPVGVVDQDGTAGQSVTYGVTVRNHATQALIVTPKLSSDGNDTIGTVAPGTINSNASKKFEFPVTLGSAVGSRKFTGDAETPTADGLKKELNFTVQAAPNLILDPASFSPKFVRASDLLTYDFSVNASKVNPPTLHLSNCTLSFAGTTTTLAKAVTIADGSQKLEFKSTKVTGEDNLYDARVQCTGIDGNDHSLSFDKTLEDLITIDTSAPVVDVAVTIPSGQTAVKDNDQVTVKVDINEKVVPDKIELVTNAGDGGQRIPCTAGLGTTPAKTHTCTVKPDFESPTTKVWAEAQVTDEAGNVAGAISELVEVDLLKPDLHVARTEKLNEISVTFEDQTTIRGGCNPTQWNVGASDVSVKAVKLYKEGSTGNPEAVDCTTLVPNSPKGQQGDALGLENVRVLVLTRNLNDSDDTPTVSYTRSGNATLADNVADEALNIAESKTITAITGILPGAPQVLTVTRTDHLGAAGEREAAYKEDGTGTEPDTATYYTNRPDITSVTGDLQVAVGAGKKGYQIQVVDGNNNPLPNDSVVVIASDNGQGTIDVPVGNSDGRKVRGVRLINAAGAGPTVFFDVVLDRVAPKVGSAAKTGTDSVTVTLTEAIPADLGTNFANDWFAFEAENNGQAKYYQVNRVSNSSDAKQRVLTVSLKGELPFGGVVYEFTSPPDTGAMRYEDKAGNQMANFHS